MKGKRRTPLPRSPTRKRKPGSKPVSPRPKGETERLAVRRRDAMKYRLAGASYRAIAEKLTEDRANAYADANGISVERAMKQLPHVSKRTAWDDVTAELEELRRETEMQRADLAGRLRYLDLRGEGPLWGPAGEARHLAALGELTPVGQRVRATCEALDARLLVVDSLAGAYGSDENTRALVRLFCASWDRWATDTRCAVMLIAHPPKTPGGAGAGQVDRDYAGSTDWHGAARWRWTLDTADTGETTPGRNGNKRTSQPVKALALAKSSYGPDGKRLFLKPSDSKIGWLGVSSTHAAHDALPDGIALEGDDEDAIQ